MIMFTIITYNTSILPMPKETEKMFVSVYEHIKVELKDQMSERVMESIPIIFRLPLKEL